MFGDKHREENNVLQFCGIFFNTQNHFSVLTLCRIKKTTICNLNLQNIKLNMKIMENNRNNKKK